MTGHYGPPGCRGRRCHTAWRLVPRPPPSVPAAPKQTPKPRPRRRLFPRPAPCSRRPPERKLIVHDCVTELQGRYHGRCRLLVWRRRAASNLIRVSPWHRPFLSRSLEDAEYPEPSHLKETEAHPRCPGGLSARRRLYCGQEIRNQTVHPRHLARPTPIILSHLAVLHLTRPRLTTHLRHPLDLSEKALEASTPREEQKSLLLTANPHGDRNNPDDARGDARARAARKAG